MAPTAVRVLRALELVEDALAVSRPGDEVVVLGVGEELLEAVVAQDVDHLRVVVVRVLVVAHAPAVAGGGQPVLAVLEPLLDQLALVLARVEAAADRRRRQRRPAVAAAAAPGQAVLHAALVVGAVLEVLDAVLDRLARDDDAGVARGAQGLHLRDGDRALVEVVAVLRADVAPAATVRLRVARVLGGAL